MTKMTRDEFINKWGSAVVGRKGFAMDLDLVLRAARDRGIVLAAEVASDYDKYNSHPYLVSDCILGKLNAMEGRPRKNPMSGKINEALTRLERKIDGLEGTIRFMVRKPAKRK